MAMEKEVGHQVKDTMVCGLSQRGMVRELICSQQVQLIQVDGIITSNMGLENITLHLVKNMKEIGQEERETAKEQIGLLQVQNMTEIG